MDDSPYNLFVIQEILTYIDPNLEITTALNGQVALDRVLEGITFDIIFLDLNMPVLDGFQARIYLINV